MAAKENLIKAYLLALPDALLACQVQEYTVKIVGNCIEVTVIKTYEDRKHIFTIDPENNENEDWWKLMRIGT